MNKLLIVLVFLIGFILLNVSVSREKSSLLKVKYISTPKTYEVGEKINLQFSTSQKIFPNLYYSNSYGSTLIWPIYENSILSYPIPLSLCRKSGLVNWKLLYKDQPLYGQFNITPKTKVNTLETYMGPPSIIAGGTDFTMFVVIPTDIYDNPLKDSTKVTIKNQFLENESLEQRYTNNLIVYKKSYSAKKTGRLIMSSECSGVNSKEYDVSIRANHPTNFTINYKRDHQYADGHQITTFSTSIIKDNFGNIVSDGTFVEFFITNKTQHVLKTSGKTIEGIATSKMIHPDQEEQWTVQAFVNGMAQSRSINLNYQPAISEINIKLSKNHKTLTVGPLQSFMKQLIPDGLEVTLNIYKDNILLKRLKKQSYNGMATFNLSKQFLKTETYKLIIKTAGIEKSLIVNGL